MLPISIQVPADFLLEEVRCDYLVSTKMKKVWAVQLDLLTQLQNVCNKYGLSYFADSGTLIGAMRHKGYIPWDDDIDIAMKREDYEKLIEVAPREFSDPYFLQNAYSDRFVKGYSRLRNSRTTCITLHDVKMKCNKGIFIDIFPLDRIPEGINENSSWIRFLKLKLDYIQVGANFRPSDFKNPLKKAVCLMENTYFRFFDYKKSFKKFEIECAKYNATNSTKMSYIEYSMGKAKHCWDASCFDGSLEVPFEFTKIWIPKGYDSRLKVEYGDYMTMRKAPTQHGTAILEPEISYIDYEKQHSRNEIVEIINRG